MGVTKLSCFVVELSISSPLFEALFFLSIKICPKNYEFGDVDRKRIILIWMIERSFAASNMFVIHIVVLKIMLSYRLLYVLHRQFL
ncbi:hypothetical protein CsatA_019169 [Cannabis sativa]